MTHLCRPFLLAVLAVIAIYSDLVLATEPNDTPGTAQSLPLGVNVLEYINPTGDIDWYRINLPQAGTLTVTVDVPSTRDYDLHVYSAVNPNILAGQSTQPTGVDEQVTIYCTPPFCSVAPTYWVRVTGFAGASSSTAPYTIRATLYAPPIITTPGGPLPTAIFGQPYSVAIQVTGGAAPYRWYVDSGFLPPGLTLNSFTGVISGVPTMPGYSAFGIQVVGADGVSSRQNFSITVPGEPPIITNAVWPPMIVGRPYSFTLQATGGLPPYRWEARTSLPPGLVLSTMGTVSGTPTAAGTFGFTIRVVGANNLWSEGHYIFTVYGAQTDPMIFSQWHLKPRSIEPGGANVTEAWNTTRGAGVVIGVVDDGLQTAHPDLQPNHVPPLSRDFNDNDSDPTPASSHPHGTAVAGVAAARGENGVGGSGVAPLAGLAGLRLIGAPATDAQEAAAFSHELASIDISSNSWGPPDDGATLRGPLPLAAAAMENAVRTGRNGRGRVFVWAAGNGRQSQDNCNFDGYANSRFVIAVGAITDSQSAPYYSEPCAGLFVVAPSNGGSRGLITTDLAGAPGYDPGDYTSQFGGTSGAAPIISGVVGLMLARNPALGWRDVQHILRRTSTRNGLPASGWTSGPYPHHEQYGFGQVDAAAAVAAAASWVNVGAERSFATGVRAVNLAIPDNTTAGIRDSIAVSTSLSIEHVEVEFTATHLWRGDLEVTLTSPAGTVSHLATLRSGDDSAAGFSSWRFTSVRHWGESATGDWTLQVTDRASGYTGTWASWRLRFYGTRQFADDPLRAGMLIRAAHVLELRDFIDEARVRLGLQPFAWNGSLAAGISLIRARDVLDLRSALREAYDAAGRTVPTWTDPSLGPGTPMKAVHITELRAAVIALD